MMTIRIKPRGMRAFEESIIAIMIEDGGMIIRTAKGIDYTYHLEDIEKIEVIMEDE